MVAISTVDRVMTCRKLLLSPSRAFFINGGDFIFARQNVDGHNSIPENE